MGSRDSGELGAVDNFLKGMACKNQIDYMSQRLKTEVRSMMGRWGQSEEVPESQLPSQCSS